MILAPEFNAEPATVSPHSPHSPDIPDSPTLGRAVHACKALARALLTVALIAALSGCSRPRQPATDSEAAATLALTSTRALAQERAAAQAYAHGDLNQAADQYQALALRYTSLAQTALQAWAWLNWARVQSELGHPESALAAIRLVLSLESLPPTVQVLAQGRLAALLLTREPSAAAEQLTRAQALCRSCAEQSALSTLRARLNMQQGDAPAARQAAASALQSAVSSADLANALRVSAQVELLMAPGLGDLGTAIANTHKALALDQGQGAASKVNTDLDLLARLYRAHGDTRNAQHYTTLLKQAQEAQSTLQATLRPQASDLSLTARPAASAP
ncbi:hypothetical protein [Curvibacter gracilis]|uniref:hypothetical protein n=1 Tax=Curvibacter gracilis TaxID=230310 RepID=UPI00048643B1|nr:hypothetical protein [Curvibacter gracilis]